MKTWLMKWSSHTCEMAPMHQKMSKTDHTTWNTGKLARKYAVSKVSGCMGGKEIRATMANNSAKQEPRKKKRMRSPRRYMGSTPEPPACCCPRTRHVASMATRGEASRPWHCEHSSMEARSRASKSSSCLWSPRPDSPTRRGRCAARPRSPPRALSCFFAILKRAAWLSSAKLRSRAHPSYRRCKPSSTCSSTMLQLSQGTAESSPA
mmetsp:Transcript_142567/g.443384  ORF Transcript_142567/g.443384 Transcript_142567/m.443384 type:complete len:207 (-) Transcript_142567:378-998(-)